MTFSSAKDFACWDCAHDSKFNVRATVSSSTISFFRRIIQSSTDDKANPDVFVSDLYYATMGLVLLDEPLSAQEADLIEDFVKKCSTGNGFIPIRKGSNFTKLMTTKDLAEDIYSTYYCIGLMILINKNWDKYKAALPNVLNSYFQKSGWIYNSLWSETKIDKRFDIELCLQALLGIKLALLLDLDPKTLPYHTERVGLLTSYLSQPRYITAVNYAVLCMIKMGAWEEIQEPILDKLCKFILNHFNNDEMGFREYQFENVKVFTYKGGADEVAGILTKHRFQSDFLAASINATTYAILLSNVLPKELNNFITGKKDVLSCFYKNQLEGKGGGYGTPVKIAKYTSFFGPLFTPLETINYYVGSTVINS